MVEVEIMRRPLTTHVKGWENSVNSDIGKLMALEVGSWCYFWLELTRPKPSHPGRTFAELIALCTGTHITQSVHLQGSLKLAGCVLSSWPLPCSVYVV